MKATPNKSKEELTKETYIKLRDQGLTNRAIALRYKISEATLYSRRSDWGLSKPRKRPTMKTAKPKEKETVQKPLPKVTEHEAEPVKKDSARALTQQADTAVSTIDFMQARMSAEHFKGYLIGNVLKHSSGPQFSPEDVKKMVWYGNKLLEIMEGGGGE
ncbi:DUF3310 domain-containing protein [Ammoniphilus oxalaticus]|uniref:DUF3310 domain-containing protein n=1 Tax=Ammoniphilus oxalaticus TaxID=66863 RepID=UPI001473E39F|nr:DUF3310 domain-containing protein [Ammoniphilus oxalaticus]